MRQIKVKVKILSKLLRFDVKGRYKTNLDIHAYIDIYIYVIELWGTTAKSHINKMEALQSIILRTMVNALWYFRNEDLRKDLYIDSH
ncbi:hypothetical protein HZH66_008847 [Vespula vulgaris]|uniref:Uncharacterized protein n=1 Tax=Vespula vulgaris TaxID=7454 RepID=A0A834JU18_VESVU|nr:hypothetical protein HZH66_008847 [Vespula vulgaris]